MATQPEKRPPAVDFEQFTVSRDLWDTVQYYFMISCVGGLAVVCGALLLTIISGAAAGHPEYLVVGVSFSTALILVTNIGILQTWRRFAERFELTDTELRWHLGYMIVVFPLRTIERIHPMGIVRVTTSVKRGVRVWFRVDPIRIPHRRFFLGSSVWTKLPGELLPEKAAWRPRPPYSVDLSPADWQRMIDSVQLRLARLATGTDDSKPHDSRLDQTPNV